MAGCQNNLRQIGYGYGQYADANGGFLPHLPTSGNEAYAGLQAAILREGGYVDRDEVFVCPGSDLSADAWFPGSHAHRGALGQRRATQDVPARQAAALMVTRSVTSTRGATRPSVIASAARSRSWPMRPIPSWPRATSANHRGRGQNTLYEDGHVEFLPTCQACPMTKDDLYHNDDWEVAPGKHDNDSVIGPSEIPPLGWDKN